MRSRWLAILGGVTGGILACALLYAVWASAVGAVRYVVETRLLTGAAPPQEEVEALYARARQRIDDWEGNTTLLLEARRDLYRVVRADPRHARAYVQLARAEYRLGYQSGETYDAGRLARAHRLLARALELDPELADAYRVRSDVYRYEKNLREARRMAERAAALDPGSLEVQLTLADVERKEGRLDEALARYVTVAAETDDPDLRADAYGGLIGVYTARGDQAAAGEAHRAVIELRPGSAWAKGNYAHFLLARGEHDRAIETARAALAIMDYGAARAVLADAHAAKGWDLLWKRRRVDEASRHFELAVEAHPYRAGGHYGLGWARLVQAGAVRDREVTLARLDEAEQAFERSLTLSSQYGDPREGLRQVQEARVRAARR